MRIYPARDEERVRLQALVREWARSGLLDDAQRAAADEALRVDLTRTNRMLRGGLALFTAIVVAASVLLIGVLFEIREHTAIAVLLIVGAVVCYAAAEWLVSALKLYRYGVEEMLAVAAAVLLAAGAFAVPPESGWAFRDRALVAFVVGALGAFGVYLRFGFVYAAIGAMAFGAAAPFQLELSAGWTHLVAAAGLAGAGIVARLKHQRYGDDCPGDEYATLQAAAYLGVYLVLNLKIFDLAGFFPASASTGRVFYWFTYVAIWIVPAVGMWFGIREKDRKLIDVAIAAALATLLTNKAYLGWTRRPWDPILLGIVLIGAAILLRRWLASAPRGERGGFTPDRILAYETEMIARMGTVTVALPRAPQASSPGPPPSPFSGGRSGGAGGGGEF